MLERTTRSYFDDFLQDHNLIALENKRNLRRKQRSPRLSPKPDDFNRSDERTMTRKTRTRRPRIAVIQSGYCAVCSVPYNSVEDHIQSKKHQKLIGEDANYIALNGSLNGFLHTNSIPFLNLNGIEAIGVHDTSLDDFSTKYKRRTMPKTARAVSVMCERIKPSPLSPTGSDTAGHHLRSRRNINYMTPPLDDDSLQEIPDMSLPEEPSHLEYKEYRELRSSTRALAKLTEQVPDLQDEVWNSGRPKRACIKQKRISIDDCPVTNYKTYYKVEVMTASKPKSSQKEQASKRHQSQSPKRDEESKDKGLIVKFKKLRNSELIQLNNEATNFLFPKKDDSSEEEENDDEDEPENVNSANEKNENSSFFSDSEDCIKTSQKFKVEDDASMDSTCSTSKAKKKRRTHAEAFIMDNQKYYKFETPGSRLRYHGSYLAPIIKSPKNNGECSLKSEEVIKTEEPEEKKPKINKNARLSYSNYNYSFEQVPRNAPWYSTFQRLDKGEQRYTFFSDYFWDPFVLPYQMPHLIPLDTKTCMFHYNQILKVLQEPFSESNSTCSTPEPSVSTSTHSMYDPELDEDSKMSATTLSSSCSIEEASLVFKKRIRRTKAAILQQLTSGKNPRKSPRQHASTLAILSSLIQQRKRRSRNRPLEEPSQNLPTIPEESLQPNTSQVDGEIQDKPPPPQQEESPQPKPKTPFRKFKKKIDYASLAQKIDDELDTALDDNLEDYDLELSEENVIDFHNSKTNLAEILKLFEDDKSKETEKTCRRFFNGTPGRKPGRKRKKNLTGWPNKNKRIPKREQSKEKEEGNSTTDSFSVNNDSDAEVDSNPTDSIKKFESAEKSHAEKSNADKSSADSSKVDKSDVTREVDRVEKDDKVLKTKVTNEVLQPYVCVQKLDNNIINKQICSPKRTVRRQRRMPGSPKSPRMLRKPRGRWYRER